MLARARILLFLAVFVFAIFSACKMFRKPNTLLSSTPASPASPAPDKVEVPVVPASPFVDCPSWGGSQSLGFWGYGEGLYFDGIPDAWGNGIPKYLRTRGRAL